jgi:hypothetical protein
MKSCKVFGGCILICFLGALNAFSQDPAPTSSINLKIFETTFAFNMYEVAKKDDPLNFVVLHHNEQTGLRVTKEIIKERGGRLFELVSTRSRNPERNLYFTYDNNEYAIDPNRLFSTAGIAKDVRKRHCYDYGTEGQGTKISCSWSRPLFEDFEFLVPEIRRFAESLLKFLKPTVKGGTVVAVHNNENRGFGLNSYAHQGSEWQSSERGLFFGKEDTDNFFLVSNENLFKRLTAFDAKTWDFNIVLQKQPPIPDDGSLSIYCGMNNWDYILVEAQSSSGAERQRQMINRLIDTFEKQ